MNINRRIGWIIICLVIGSIAFYIGVSLFYYNSIRYTESNPEMLYDIGFDTILTRNNDYCHNFHAQYISFNIISSILIVFGLALLIIGSALIYKYSSREFVFKKWQVLIIIWMTSLFLLSIIIIGILQEEIIESDQRITRIMKIIKPPIILTPHENTIDTFSVANYELKKTTAEVEQMQGVYVFFHSKPVMEYYYLGSFTSGIVPTKNAKGFINYMIKKGKEKFPASDAIIFTDDELVKADFVKFK